MENEIEFCYYDPTCPNCGAKINQENFSKNKDDEGYTCNFCGTKVKV